MYKFWDILIRLPTDYTDYGGEIQRWADPALDYPDCSSGCRHWHAIDLDWGICTRLNSPRSGMLTFEHQAGHECFEYNTNIDWTRQDLDQNEKNNT